jgi:transcription elongation factor Elf1
MQMENVRAKVYAQFLKMDCWDCPQCGIKNIEITKQTDRQILICCNCKESFIAEVKNEEEKN